MNKTSSPRKYTSPLRQPYVGEVFPAGTVIRILKPKGRNRATRVGFRCARCSGYGKCRYVFLVSGRQMSCGCGSKKQCKINSEDRANNYAAAIPAAVLIQIVATAEVEGLDATVAKTGLDRNLISTLWRVQRQRVFREIDATRRELIHTAAQRMGYSKTAAKFSVPLYVVMLVSRISHRIGKATREAAALTAGTLRDAVEIADGTMNALVSMPGRYRRGEFCKAELPPPSKANRSPIFRAYAFLKTATIPTSLQTLVSDFTGAIENTYAARKRRSLKFIRNNIRPTVLFDEFAATAAAWGQ